MVLTRLTVIIMIVLSIFNPSLWLWTIIALVIVELDWISVRSYYKNKVKIVEKPVETIKFKDSPIQQNKINELESKLVISKTSVEGQLAYQTKEINRLIKENASLSILVEKQAIQIDELKEQNVSDS